MLLREWTFSILKTLRAFLKALPFGQEFQLYPQGTSYCNGKSVRKFVKSVSSQPIYNNQMIKIRYHVTWKKDISGFRENFVTFVVFLCKTSSVIWLTLLVNWQQLIGFKSIESDRLRYVPLAAICGMSKQLFYQLIQGRHREEFIHPKSSVDIVDSSKILLTFSYI